MSSSANETGSVPHDILYGGSINLVANTFVSGISWGFMTSIYAVCIYSLIRNLRSAQASRKTAFLAVWVTLLWILSSISTIADAACTLYAYSWKLDFPGGPFIYLVSIQGQPVPALVYTSYLLTMWIADAMMLWRLVVCYKGVRPLIRGMVLCFMFLIYIGSVGTGCFTMVLSSSSRSIFSTLSKKVAIPCIVLSMTLNVFATAFIAIRLLVYKRLMDRNLGKMQTQESPYTSIAAMLIESSALYGAWSLAFIIVYALCNPGEYVMLAMLCNVQVIAPLLIVYRVSKGTALEETMSSKSSSTLTRPVFFDNHGGSEAAIVFVRESEQQISWDSDFKTMSSDPPQVEYKGTSV